jgi:hypothetical protein
MLYLPISRSWLFSRIAQRIDFASAVLSFALIATVIGVHTAMAMAGTRKLTAPASSVVRVLLSPEVVGAAVLWIAMWYFWFGFDRAHYMKRATWFLILFFFAPLGPAFYYFFVYRRSVFVPHEGQTTDVPKRL